MLTRLTQNFYLFQNGEYLVACHRDEAISNIKIKNTKGLAPLDSLLLCLIHPSLFSFRLSFPYLPLSFTHPFRHSRASGNPGRTGSPIRSALLSVEDDKGCVIPVKTGIQAGLDPQSEALCFRLRMTKGVSFP